ncbi:MAG: signal peptidase I [Gammaproteobacteria bacterium]|nr:signal peptidase I [Gammaproteobacteria bacterium]
MTKPNRVSRTIKNNLSILFVIFGILFFRTAVADWSYVPSGSMEPTLYEGDYVWIDKTYYGPSIPLLNFRLGSFGKPDRGDIVTFVPPHTDDLFVKRVIGTPGDKIRFQGPNIFINDEKLDLRLSSKSKLPIIGQETIDKVEHLIQLSGNIHLPRNNETIVVPDSRYFVMGDHRNNSADSRYWGFVEEDQIMGKVTHVAVSFSNRRPASRRFRIKLQ